MALELYYEYLDFNKINNKLHDIVLKTSTYPILNEYLKIYFQTDKGRKNINLKNNNGETALMLASKYSNTDSSIETVKILIDYGANVNLQDKNVIQH